MVFLRPYVGDPRNFHFEGFGVDAIDQNLSQNEYMISPRVWLGYVGNCGFGAQCRFWSFDQGLNAETDSFQSNNFTADISGNSSHVCPGHGSHAANGPRFVESQHRRRVPDSAAPSTHSRATTREKRPLPVIWASPTPSTASVRPFSPSFRRPIGCRGVSLVGNTRGSLLYGNRRLEATGTFVNEEIDNFVIRETSDAPRGHRRDSAGAEWDARTPQRCEAVRQRALGSPNMGRLRVDR